MFLLHVHFGKWEFIYFYLFYSDKYIILYYIHYIYLFDIYLLLWVSFRIFMFSA